MEAHKDVDLRGRYSPIAGRPKTTGPAAVKDDEISIQAVKVKDT